jgi:hypothetical protein
MGTEQGGYRRKPWWILAFAGILITASVGNVLVSFLTQGIYRMPWPAWKLWFTLVRPESWALNALLLSGGIALLRARVWTYSIAMALLVLTLAYNFVFAAELGFMPAPLLWLMRLATVVFMVLLSRSELRRPYLEPRSRWWETEARHQIEGKVQLRREGSEGEGVEAQLRNISRSGVFVEAGDASMLDVDATYLVDFKDEKMAVRARCVRQEGSRYGFQFLKDSIPQWKRLRQWVAAKTSSPETLVR